MINDHNNTKDAGIWKYYYNNSNDYSNNTGQDYFI